MSILLLIVGPQLSLGCRCGGTYRYLLRLAPNILEPEPLTWNEKSLKYMFWIRNFCKDSRLKIPYQYQMETYRTISFNVSLFYGSVA